MPTLGIATVNRSFGHLGYTIGPVAESTEAPSCELTKQWDESEGGLLTSRYAGADGCIYERISPVSRPAFWVRVEH
jgi:hypothetical protein